MLDIIYISSTCSAEKYTEYVESKGSRALQQAQKYNLLFAEGLAENGANIKLVSSRPINRSLESRLWFGKERETAQGVEFVYVPFINYPLLRNIFVFFGVFFETLFSHTQKENTAVVCDALNISATLAAQWASALRGYKTVGIVTDVPCHFAAGGKVKSYERVNLRIMQSFDCYLLLTKPMSEIVNPKDRPYIVLEGHSDSSMANTANTLENKFDKRVCLYAGSLRRIYGIGRLVEGFLKADIDNTELHIYGDGDYADELKSVSEKHENIKYFGTAPNSAVVEAELRASLLVNPRPTDEEYTKYSFPSKNMEYMVSGTPLLTTHLPGMPDDHRPYVFIIEDESADGICDALKRVFEKKDRELHEFGRAAKEYILENKSNVKQAERALKFFESVRK